MQLSFFFCLALPAQNLVQSATQCGEVVFGQAVHSHQVDVSVLLPLELLSTHVARPVHVQFHVSVKLKFVENHPKVSKSVILSPDTALQRSCHTPPWRTCSWCCAFEPGAS